MMSHHLSELEVANEVIDMLLSNKISKTTILKDLVTQYPRVFLSICNYEYASFVPEEDLDGLRAQIDDLCIRYAELERQVDLLVKEIKEGKTYPECLPDSLPESRDTLPGFAKDALLIFQAGAKIRAIKMVMSLTGCNLVKSKAFCETLNKRFGETPESEYPRG